MPASHYLDAIYEHNAAYKHANPNTPTPLNGLEDLVNTLPPPLRAINEEFRCM
jgi:hypothetical protein